MSTCIILFGEHSRTFMLSSLFWIDWTISSQHCSLYYIKSDDSDRSSGWLGSKGLRWENQLNTTAISSKSCFQRAREFYMLLTGSVSKICQRRHGIMHLGTAMHAIQPHKSDCFCKSWTSDQPTTTLNGPHHYLFNNEISWQAGPVPVTATYRMKPVFRERLIQPGMLLRQL